MFPVWRVGTFTATLLAFAGCGGGDSYCPGRCAVDSTHPKMTIEVAGGAALLASAKILGGPCSHLLVRSSGEAGVPTGYAAVQVTYNGTTTSPLPLCLIEVTSLDGQVTDVTAEARATSLEQACCPTQTCCAKSQAVTVHHAVAFTQPVQTVTFESVDAGALDAGAQLDSGTAVDTAGDDAPIIGPSGTSGISDTSEPADAEIDASLDDGGAALDVLVDI
jgi:hypothetical protein